ncbi:serine hydrolase domain-containing protein [Kitasatospora sp. NBC_01266]|uniref:serine hydrolase domain-containing protein n=1 Tax=Kitasatospora sp. NBC_01266 TaxID=2903572 RepID=UPI002E3820D2|nr:serine hydrolase domain-containing protein [Kitasatospora sp. NBC_01266]
MRPAEGEPAECCWTDGDPARLAPLVDAVPPGSAVALAVVRDGVTALSGHGRVDGRRGDPITPDTAFELGSVSKTFTALLLAERVARGELDYDLPIDTLLAPGPRPQLLRGGAITLLHLATHTSGLPRLPPGLSRTAFARLTNPYEEFTRAKLLQALARTRIRTSPGSRVRYSNYGVGLLGHLVAGADQPPWDVGTAYADLLAERVGRPLGLNSTACGPNPVAQAVGHWHGRPVPPWRMPALPGAGAVRSTARDLARYLGAHLAAAADQAAPGADQAVRADDPDGLARALGEVQRPRLVHSRAPGADELCLVWNLRRLDGCQLLFHGGATRGFTTFIGFCPQARAGVAALTNTGPTLDGRFGQAAYQVLKSLLPCSV